MIRDAEEMTDEQLVAARSITECLEASDGGWECVLSCGHQIVMVVQPVTMELSGCAQCLEILLDRMDKRER
jgi:xanthine/CO dehydrogenase XdhC/CoxF family maturation factor